MSDADLIRTTLQKVRRRQFLLLWLDSSVIALLAFALWMLLCKLGFIVLPYPSLGVHLAAVILLFSASLVVSIRRMPSWKESIKRVDGALGLQQRLETSWENIPPRDEIDSLLLADAGRRIVQLRPASIAPMRLGRIPVLCIFIMLSAIAILGIFRVLLDWNKNIAGVKENIAIRTMSGSSPSKKGLAKAQQKSRSKNLKMQSYLAVESNHETRPPVKNEAHRAPAPVPNRFGIREAKQPSNSAPDSDVAGKKTNTGRSTAKAAVMQSNAGASSVRKADKNGGAPANARQSSDPKAEGNALAAGQGKSVVTKKDTAFQNEYMNNYPAAWSATEQALAKENIPPGMKKYIIDYFNAIHP